MSKLPPVCSRTCSATASIPAVNARGLPQSDSFQNTFGPSTACANAGPATDKANRPPMSVVLSFISILPLDDTMHELRDFEITCEFPAITMGSLLPFHAKSRRCSSDLGSVRASLAVDPPLQSKRAILPRVTYRHLDALAREKSPPPPVAGSITILRANSSVSPECRAR